MITRFPTDPSNLIELPGVGPVPRPTDLDGSKTGFGKLVSLRIYTFSQGQTIHGEAEGDEVVIVFLEGSLSVTATGAETMTWEIVGRKNVFAGPAQAVYLPPGYSYRLELHTDAQVAYARARAEGQFPPRLLENPSRRQNGAAVTPILGPGESEALECHEFLLSRGESYDLGEQAESLTHVRLEAEPARCTGRGEEHLALQNADTIAADEANSITASPDGGLYGLTVRVRQA